MHASHEWYRPHPYGVYPRGNASRNEDITDRLGALSSIVSIKSARQQSSLDEQPYLDVVQNILSFLEVPDLCELSNTCTGWYVLVHCTDAFKTAYGALSPNYMRFTGSWKETAIRGYLSKKEEEKPEVGGEAQRRRLEKNDKMVSLSHTPVAVSRPYFCDVLFQMWLCTILPLHYPLKPEEPGPTAIPSTTQYRSSFKPVDRRAALSPEEFVEQYEQKYVPVVMTDIVPTWPIYQLLEQKFENFSKRKNELTLPGKSETPMRCEFTHMSIEDYVRYAQEQRDERPIYMFDAEFASALDTDRLFTVPDHFARDDYFRVLGNERPKYRWLIAGPHRGGSAFHVDPNYTHAWNANLTGRKRWFFFPPSCPPPGVVPSGDMTEVATPVSLTEWLLNFYDETVNKLKHQGYECVCEPGDLIFVPAGWWHSVINLEDSVALTQNYVSRSNLHEVLKFLRAMKSSISGINEDLDSMTPEALQARRDTIGDQFAAAMRTQYPEVMEAVTERQRKEKEERAKLSFARVQLLDSSSEGFTFSF